MCSGARQGASHITIVIFGGGWLDILSAIWHGVREPKPSATARDWAEAGLGSVNPRPAGQASVPGLTARPVRY